LLYVYFNHTDEALVISNSMFSNITSQFMAPETVLIWTSIYFATSVIWLGISGFLLYDSCKSKFTSKIILSWVAVSAVVAVIDLAGTVTFGVDYDRVQQFVDSLSEQIRPSVPTESFLVPIFMMMMCARGFILWIINVGLVIYLGLTAVNRLNEQGSPNLLKEPEHLSHSPPMNSNIYSQVGPTLVNPPKEDFLSQGRNNPTFHPEPVYAWNTTSPTVGNQQRNTWDFQPNNSPRVNDVVNPIQPLPRVGKAVTSPVPPLPIPHPDYSPPLGRPKRHEPYVYDGPIHSVLKKPNPTGRTIL